MNKRKRLIVSGLSAVLCILLIFPAHATKSGLQAAKDKMSALQAEKKKTEATLAKLEGLKSNTIAYVRELDASLESINDELVQLADDITVKEGQIEDTQLALAEAKEVEKTQYESMKLRIKYMYEKGDSSYIDLLMSSESLSNLLNKAEYVRKISEYDRQMLDEYVATKEQIAETERVLQGEHEDLLVLQEETEAKQAAVEDLLAAKQKELANYESQIKDAEGQISEYAKDMEAQENAIKAIEEEIRRQEEEARKRAEQAGQSYKTVNLGDISFKWPCPSSSRIISGFGSRSAPTKGASSNHQGIDIGASTGSNITAAASGTVVVSAYSASAGNYIMINHGGGVYTVYMHASKLLASVGDKVSQGQVIAQVGSTGNSTGPHLHFGIRVNGTYVNPRQYVSP